MLEHDYGGFQVTRLTHCLQTATRAYRDGKDSEYVVCALIHDIGDNLAPANHAELAATILEQGIEPGSAIWVNYEHGKYSINHRNFDAAEDLGEYYLSNQDNTPEEKPEDIGLKPKKEQIDRNTLI